MPTILDFQIQPLSSESYSLTVCERGSSQPLASATFSHRVDFLTDFSVDRLNASTKDPAERFDELQKLGRELYQKLFPLAVEQLWREYKQRSEFLVLCLRFAEGAAKLEVLPWETLHDGAEFIAAGHKTTPTTLTRLPLDVAPQSELPPIPRPLKLFGFFASPLDLQDHERLNAEREQEILLEAINDPAGQGRISADFEDEAKLEILERSLRDGYHILHFTGHGISPRDGGGLLLEDAQGKKLPASIADVMQAVERGQDGKDKLRLAVISGCQTARTLHTGAFSDLARELLRQRVPAVIAMQFSITDEGGLKFAEVLYREIAKGVELERAVYAARRVLLEYNTGKRTDFDVNSDALAIVLLAADGACLQTTEAQSLPPQAEPSATYLGDRLDLLAHGFYGRRREYRKLRDALLHQDQRAIIIHGIGGIGKTALLTHAINRLRPRFKDVMSFDCRRAALAPETILLELHRYFAAQGMPQLQSLIGQNVPPETLADEIARMLTEWPLLIVFDNFESQLDEQREFINKDLRVFLTTLVRATATGSRFLFTTRYLFDLDGERLGNLQELPLGDLSRPEALMLMQKLPNLAQAAHRDKLAVLKKFGGHPYALVTLNRHCSHQSLDQALQDANLLKSELREYLAIELNYQRLSDQARELLNRLAAFRDITPFAATEWMMGKRIPLPQEYVQSMMEGFKQDGSLQKADDKTLLAAIEIMTPEQRQAPDVTLFMTELVEWGLMVLHVEDGQPEAFSVHSLVRDFCRDQQIGDRWQFHLRDAAAFYTNQTKALKQDDKSREAIWGEVEAFELLIEAKDYERAAWSLIDAHALLNRWGFSRYVESQYPRLLGNVDRHTTAIIIGNLAVLAQSRGDYDKALKDHERVAQIFAELGNRAEVAVSHLQIGLIHQNREEYEEALSQYNQSLKIQDDLGDRANKARLLHQIGIIHHYQRDYETAMSYSERSLVILEELEDQEGLAGVLHQMGMIHRDRGESDAALLKYEQSLRISEKLGDLSAMEHSLHHIGMIHQDRKDYATALTLYQQSLEIAEELGNPMSVAESRSQLGFLFTQLGHYSEAFTESLSALKIFIELPAPGHVRTAANDLRNLRVRWGVNEFDVAWREATKQELPEWLTDESEATAS